MGKLTKKDRIKVLEWQVKTLIQSMTNIEEWSSCADNMLTDLNHALPDPEYDAKCEAAVAGVEASLDRHRERLGLNKPQLKQLDQSVFDGLDEKWRFAAVDDDGRAYVFMRKPEIDETDPCFIDGNTTRCKGIGESYDASNWQNSLIERDTAKELLDVDLSSELTGSELCKAMINKNDWVLAYVSDENDATAEFHQRPAIVTGATIDGRFKCSEITWRFAVPINNQGEPLTASEVGL